ncbi:MAG: RsmE family RNA methyltransferase [Acidimicrobiales bacterium]|nr:RsmE family RNA methyltransferase [Acidimicrobiales bacterium]
MTAHPADHPGPLVFVADLDAPELSDDDRHHLTRVLRSRPGAPLTVADGSGRWRTATLDGDPEPTGPIQVLEPPRPRLTVGIALVKGEKPELVVQKLTELGIDRIVLFRAARSVVRWDAVRAERGLARLRLVARSAAMQCHRPDLPVVEEVADLGPFLAAAPPGEVALAHRDGAPVRLDQPTVLVGPEGGWAPAELALDLPCVRLAGHILRAETAAITAGALLAQLRDAASR